MSAGDREPLSVTRPSELVDNMRSCLRIVNYLTAYSMMGAGEEARHRVACMSPEDRALLQDAADWARQVVEGDG